MIQVKLLLDTSMSARVLAAPYPFWQINAQTQCLRTRVPAHRTGGDRSAASKALHFARCLCGCNMLNPKYPYLDVHDLMWGFHLCLSLMVPGRGTLRLVYSVHARLRTCKRLTPTSPRRC